MTLAMLDAVLSTVHLMEVHQDGDCYRAICWCGWGSLPQLTEAQAWALTCDVEQTQIEGRQRTAAFLARRRTAA